MSGLKHAYFPLTGATMVMRRHDRELTPPNLKVIENALISRSDEAITLRPDLYQIEEDVLAEGRRVKYGINDEPDDYLNSAHGLWGSDSATFFTRFSAMTADSTGSTLIHSEYGTGTVSNSASSKTLTGSGTSWLQNVWSGCYMHIASEGKYYLVDSVDSNTQITTTAPIQDAHSGSTYTIYQNHCALNTNRRLNIQSYSSGLVYNAPPNTNVVDASRAHGPLSSLISETSEAGSWVFHKASFSSGTASIDDVWPIRSARIVHPDYGAVAAFIPDTDEPYIYVCNSTFSQKDGLTWQRVDLSYYNSEIATVVDIQWGFGYFWILGIDSTKTKIRGGYSSDGVSWSTFVCPDVSTGTMTYNDIHITPSYVIVGNKDGQHYASREAITGGGTITWALATGSHTSGTAPSRGAYGNGYLAIATESNLHYSIDEGATFSALDCRGRISYTTFATDFHVKSMFLSKTLLEGIHYRQMKYSPFD